MGSLSNYAENKLLDHVLKVAAFTVPTNLYFAFSTADPLDDASGNAEPSGFGYERTLCNSWSAASSRAISNSADITFPQASGSWGTIAYWSIWDAQIAGNMIAHGAFSASKAVVSGNIPKVNAGDVDISFNSGGVTTYLANKLLDHVFKVGAYTVPTNLYAGLSTTSPGDAGSTTGEPNTGNYARVLVNSWNTASGGASANTNDITFPTASGSWGTIGYIFISDTSTINSDTNTLLQAAVSVPQAVAANDIPKFVSGDVDITLD